MDVIAKDKLHARRIERAQRKHPDRRLVDNRTGLAIFGRRLPRGKRRRKLSGWWEHGRIWKKARSLSQMWPIVL